MTGLQSMMRASWFFDKFNDKRSIDNVVDIEQLTQEIRSLTEEQKKYFNIFIQAVETGTGGLFFLDGPGGYGM